MNKFYIVFHESKHGLDYYVENSLEESIKTANDITQKYYNDYATHYKDVKMDGVYDDIYIKSFSIENQNVAKEDVQLILSSIVIRPHCLPTEDNVLDLTKFNSLSQLLQKHSFTLGLATESYKKAYYILDHVGKPVLITTKYKNEENLHFKKAIDTGREHSYAIGVENYYERDINKNIEELDKWISQWVDEDYLEKEIDTKEGKRTLLYAK